MSQCPPAERLDRLAERSMARKDNKGWGKVASVGLEIAAGAGIGAVTGTWIDRKWHTDPWGVLIGTVLGISAGMYILIKEAMKANKD
jgi:F0F1-type ATP synthase assembly protein I